MRRPRRRTVAELRFRQLHGDRATAARRLPLVEDAKVHPCDIAGMYYFHGNCVKFTLSVTGNTTVELGKFGAYTASRSRRRSVRWKIRPRASIGRRDHGRRHRRRGDITGTVKGKAVSAVRQGRGLRHLAGQEGVLSRQAVRVRRVDQQSKYTLKPKDTPKFYITDSQRIPGNASLLPGDLDDARPHTAGGWAPNDDARRTAARDDADDPRAAESGTAHLSRPDSSS